MHKEVALLAEGVDRNLRRYRILWSRLMSPSSRRAWIEMHWFCRKPCLASVALLAEGVDRNFKAVLYKDGKA